ncbi:MAG: hypothetical protein M1142_01965 [Patescibacteria group bacterium]|nr:hypothetical protein [Patescibacteria group bacterium]
MRKIRDITEDEMISVFLKAEINSNRFGKHILDRLQRDSKSRDLIEFPNLNNVEENQYRKQLLSEYRGFGMDQALFQGLPTDVKWQRVLLTTDDLNKIKYINYSYWNELSQKTRFAKNAVEIIEKGIKIFNVSNQGFIDAAEAVKEGVIFPEMILVSAGPNEDIIVIEGHLRLTAYLLAKEKAPAEIESIIGYSPKLISWGLY